MHKNGGYDIKTTFFSEEKKGGADAYFRAKILAPQDFGNYNFGIAAKADGIPLEIALLGAVAYQIYSGTSNMMDF